jgi:hypothetical protein
MMRRVRGLLVLIVAAGCGRTGSVAPAARALAYGVPVPPTLDYVSGDSARIEIAAAGQQFAVTANVRERWRMAFAAAPGGTRVTATLTDMDARMTSPLSSPATADESAVTGPVVFTLDARGRVAVDSVPTIEPAVAQFLNGYGIAHGFFPRLPGRPVASGQSWTDTVAYVTDEGGAKTTVESVTTFTAAGDSLVDGATYLLVRTQGSTRQESTGTIGGTSFTQKVGGTTSGQFLWDAAAGTLEELVYGSELTGTMDVAISPVPLDVTITSSIRQRRVRP